MKIYTSPGSINCICCPDISSCRNVPEPEQGTALNIGDYVLVPHIATRWERFKSFFGYITRKYDVCRVESVHGPSEEIEE